jgi:hypothetical protein
MDLRTHKLTHRYYRESAVLVLKLDPTRRMNNRGLLQLR